MQQMQLQEHLRAVWNSVLVLSVEASGRPLDGQRNLSRFFGSQQKQLTSKRNLKNHVVWGLHPNKHGAVLRYEFLCHGIIPTFFCVSSRGLCVAQDVSSDDGEQALVAGKLENHLNGNCELLQCIMS